MEQIKVVILTNADNLLQLHNNREMVLFRGPENRYRFKTGTPALTMPGSQDQVINLVLEERRQELPLGHLKRFFDLKRFCLEPGKPWGKTKITHTVGTETYEGVIDSPTFVLPIPNTVLSFNPQWNIPLDTRPFS